MIFVIEFRVNDWFELHKGFKLNLSPGFTALVGPNGAGKTTLLRQIEQYAKDNGIRVWKYSNLIDGGDNARQKYLHLGMTDSLAATITGSEGELVAYNFSQVVTAMGSAVRDATMSGQKLIVLLDAIDSGASIDRARELFDLFQLIHSDATKSQDVYVIMAVNHFELVKYPVDCVNVRNGKHLSFKTYDTYAKFICTFEEKFKRTNKEE